MFLVVPLIHQRMRFNIRLCHDIQTVLVTQIVQIFIVAVMRCAERIEVVLFHRLNILPHRLFRHIFPVYRVCVVPVCSLEQKRLSVNRNRLVFFIRRRTLAVLIYLTADKFYLSKSQLLGNTFNISACLLMIERHYHRVQIRLLGRPQQRFIDDMWTGSSDNRFRTILRRFANRRDINGITIHKNISGGVKKPHIYCIIG